MSLRLKVIISFIVIYATTSTIFVLSIIQDQHQLIEEAVKDSYLTVAKTLANTCSDALVEDNVAFLRKYIKRIGQDDNVEYVLIQDANNFVIASIEDKDTPLTALFDSQKANAATDVLIQEVGEPPRGFFHGSGHLFDITVPIFDNGRKLGLTRIGVSTMGVNQQVIQSSYRGLRWVIIAVAIGIVVIVLVDWRLRRIFGKLIEITQRMASGDLKQRIEINTGDALQILGDSFNQMAQNLKQSQEELQSFSHQLERRVKERTKELKEAQTQLIQSEKLASIGELAGNISHEINNPVGIILSRLECMMLDAEEQDLPEEFLSDLRVLEKHASRIANITGGLLTFSRNSAEKFALLDVNSATNKDLQREIDRGNFREELYYRLNVVLIYLPSLRERKSDISLLAKHFLQQAMQSNPKSVSRISAAAMKLLECYSWPGNVRELQNVIERAVSLTEREVIQPEDLSDFIHSPQKGVLPFSYENDSFKEAKEEIIEAFEKEYLINLLREHNGNISQAARTAGIDRRTIHRLIRKYNLKPVVGFEY